MKKSILTIAIVVCSAISFNVKAQTNTSLGIKANMNLTDIRLSGVSEGRNKFHAGGAVGGFVKIEFNENFALRPELILNYTESKIRHQGESTRYKYGSVELPVYAVGQLPLGNGKLFLGVGPHIGYGFSIDTNTELIPDGAPGDNKLEMSHWYLGGGVTAGYEFKNGIMVNAGYQLGYDLRSSRTVNIKTQTISIGIGYKF